MGLPHLTSSLFSKKNSGPNRGCGWRTSCSETLPLFADNDAFIQIKSGTHFPEELKHVFLPCWIRLLTYLARPSVLSVIYMEPHKRSPLVSQKMVILPSRPIVIDPQSLIFVNRIFVNPLLKPVNPLVSILSWCLITCCGVGFFCFFFKNPFVLIISGLNFTGWTSGSSILGNPK